jgi:ribosome-binding factor A
MNEHRTRRVEDAIRDTLSEVLLRDLRDPGLPAILTITRVEAARDLSSARVYFTQLPDDDIAVSETLRALDRARGFLRSAVAKRVRLRVVPDFIFQFDRGSRNVDRVEQLLAQARRDLPADQAAPELEDE